MAALDFELPRGWEVVQLADAAWPQAGFAFKSSAFNDVGQGLPLIRIRDVGSSSPTTYYAGEFREEFVVHKGDWLISMDGDFRVAPWTGPDALLNQRVTRLVFFGDAVQPLYVCLALQQELFKLQGTKAYTTVDHLSGGQIASRPIPLPPLAEQHRIVARVEELMKLCDALEGRGRLADEQHARLTTTLFGLLAASESPQALADHWQRIAEHFDLLLDRPEAIDALEQVILELAVRGLLVNQEAGDEPASVLMAKVRATKDQELAAGSLKRGKPTPPVDDTETPYALPSGWCWVRLAEVVTKLGAGSTPLGGKDVYTSTGIKFLRSQNVWNDGLRVFDAARISSATHEGMAATVVKPNDLLFNITGASIGRCALVPSDFDEANVSQHVTIVRPALVETRHFLHLVLISNHVQRTVRNVQVGVSREGLSIAKLGQFVVPLPPLAEQHRIVARVDELRRLCAQLRENLVAARQTQTRLADALVAQAIAV